MPYEYRPDLLPFALPTRVGCPWHGLVTNGVLAAGNGRTKTYAQPTDGSNWEVANPTKADTRTKTDEEIAFDLESGQIWQSYALLANYGTEKRIGAVAIAYNEWLYCDPAGTVWRLRLGITKSTTKITLHVRNVGRFGVLKNSLDPVISTLLATKEHEVTLPSWWNDGYVHQSSLTAYDLIVPVTISATSIDHSVDGAAAVWNIKSIEQTVGILGPSDYYTVSSDLLGWAEISVSGTGSLEATTFGEGLSVGITTYGLSDVWEATTRDDSNPPRSVSQSSTYQFDAETTEKPSKSCPSDGGFVFAERTDVTQSFVTNDNKDESNRILKIRAKLFCYADGTFAKRWTYIDRSAWATLTLFGRLTYDSLYEWTCPFGSWVLQGTNCVENSLGMTERLGYSETFYWGFSVGAATVEMQNYVEDGTEVTEPVLYPYGPPCPSSAEDEEIYTLINGRITDEYGEVTNPQYVREVYLETTDRFLYLSQVSKNCWVWVSAIELEGIDQATSEVTLSERNAKRTLLTTAAGREYLDTSENTAISATIEPHTGQVAWSDDNALCFV